MRASNATTFSFHPPGRSSLRRRNFERRIWWLAFFTGFPGALVALLLLWIGDYSFKLQLTLTILIVFSWLLLSFLLRERVVFPLQTLSNLLAALREGDYSIRARGAGIGDVFGEVVLEVNALSENLREQRLDALEATNLLRKVMGEIDVAVFTFDGTKRLRLVNRAGERLLLQPSERILGQTAAELGLAECLEGEDARTVQMTFAGIMGRWGLKRTSFRQGGTPHHLLVLTDLSKALRAEERQAWQRIIRVIGHELNNSLAPIKSMAATLEGLVRQSPASGEWMEDMRRGLSVIAARADALSRFMAAYSRLARLPQPRLQIVRVEEIVRRVARLETRMPVQLVEGPELTMTADPDQLEQLLINLLQNAVEAASQTQGGVRMGWTKKRFNLEIWVEDDGPGLPDTGNLFVPFFTTKPGGTGIGLALSRQIAEAHGGALSLENRRDRPGCRARFRLPLPPV